MVSSNPVRFCMSTYIRNESPSREASYHTLFYYNLRLCRRFSSRYTHGKPVIGTAVVSLSLAGRNGSIVPFARHNIMVSNY